MKERILILIAVIALVKGYDSLSNEKEIIHYYQLNSHYPIVHVFYNRSFPNSKQFSDFIEVIETLDKYNHDYARFLITNCDEIPQRKIRSCQILRQTINNHIIVGYQPSAKFLNYGGRKMQSPPIQKQFVHQLKIYQIQEIQVFLKSVLPNFYEQIDSLEQYQTWLEPYYFPNLIFASRDDQLPQVLIKLGVHYFLRFDLAFVSDLSNGITKKLNITSFPVLLVVTFNFTNSQHQIVQYPYSDFSVGQYNKIKQFLQPLALKKQRNDVLFHKIKMPIQSQIITTKSTGQLAEVLDQANRWSIISLYQDRPIKLEALKNKYGDFFQYYHLKNDKYQEQTLQMFDRSYDMQSNNMENMRFLTLNNDEFVRNTSLWLSKDFVVVGVRQKYSHFCSLQLSTLFRGLIHCMAIFDNDYQEVSKSLKLQFDVGFVCAENYVNGTRKINWQNFKSPNYQTVYRTIQYATNLKTKQIVDQFLQKPINQIQTTIKLSELCSFPTKKCVFLMTHPNKKSNTAFEYLSEVAKDFILEYKFFQIDLSCNTQFNDEIENLKLDQRGLFVYHPRKDSYIYQKTKITKVAIKKFLKTSLKESENNPLKKLHNKDIIVHPCVDSKRESDSL